MLYGGKDIRKLNKSLQDTLSLDENQKLKNKCYQQYIFLYMRPKTQGNNRFVCCEVERENNRL